MNFIHTLGPDRQIPSRIDYLYDFQRTLQYLAAGNNMLAALRAGPRRIYDFSSDLVTGFRSYPVLNVEQIISRGYLAVPAGDPATAVISDTMHTSKLGLDDIIGQIRNRYELYERNIYDIEISKCAVISSLYSHEAHHGPADGRVEYAVNKRLDKLYTEQREERVNCWRDVSKLRLLLPENAQQYLSSYRKVSILEDAKGEVT